MGPRRTTRHKTPASSSPPGRRSVLAALRLPSGWCSDQQSDREAGRDRQHQDWSGREAGVGDCASRNPQTLTLGLTRHAGNSVQVAVHEIQYILSIHAEDTAGARAIAIQTKVGNAGDDIAVTQEIRAA